MILLLDAMAACPALHKLIHQDADSASHQCAVTMFAHGQVNCPAVEVVAIVPVALVHFLLLNSVPVFNAPVATLPPGRGPPAFSFNS